MLVDISLYDRLMCWIIGYRLLVIGWLLGFALFIHNILIMVICKYVYFARVINNRVVVGYQLSIGLNFLLGCCRAIYVYYLVCSCTYSSCTQGCNAQKEHNYN